VSCPDNVTDKVFTSSVHLLTEILFQKELDRIQKFCPEIVAGFFKTILAFLGNYFRAFFWTKVFSINIFSAKINVLACR